MRQKLKYAVDIYRIEYSVHDWAGFCDRIRNIGMFLHPSYLVEALEDIKFE